MYNKQEASAVRQKFWMRFGQYMAPVPLAGGGKGNWLNYKTGIKGIFFKMDADNNRAFVAVEISSGEVLVQQQYFDLFLTLQKPFESIAGGDWTFSNNYTNESGKAVCRISTELNNINVFRESDWPNIISFLKKNMMALDLFWSEYKDVFEMRI